MLPFPKRWKKTWTQTWYARPADWAALKGPVVKFPSMVIRINTIAVTTVKTITLWLTEPSPGQSHFLVRTCLPQSSDRGPSAGAGPYVLLTGVVCVPRSLLPWAGQGLWEGKALGQSGMRSRRASLARSGKAQRRVKLDSLPWPGMWGKPGPLNELNCTQPRKGFLWSLVPARCL